MTDNCARNACDGEAAVSGVEQVPVPDLGCLTEPEFWWEDLDFRSLRPSGLEADGAEVVGTCRWEDILEDGDERLEEDAVLRLATVKFEESLRPEDDVRDLPDHGSAYPTLLWDVLHLWSGYFSVRDGSVHLSFSNAHSLEHTVADPEGEDFVAVEVLPSRDGQILPVYAVTDTGTTVMYEYHWDEEREFTHTVRGRTLVGQGECDGTRSVRADPSGDTVLTLCTTDSGPYGQQTEVTALREGEDFIPAG